MCPSARFSQFVLGAPPYYFAPEVYERLKHLLEVEDFRLAIYDGQIYDSERGLHRGQLIKLVKDDLSDGISLKLDYDSHALPVRLVTQVRNTVQLLFIDQFGDTLDKSRLVHLKWNLGDDDSVALLCAPADSIYS